jgi:hypothetical protein
LFKKGGPHPWKTKPGDSLLDQRILDVREHGGKTGGIAEGMEEERVEYGKKNAGAV